VEEEVKRLKSDERNNQQENIEEGTYVGDFAKYFRIESQKY
jgi:hypothetical protein